MGTQPAQRSWNGANLLHSTSKAYNSSERERSVEVERTKEGYDKAQQKIMTKPLPANGDARPVCPGSSAMVSLTAAACSDSGHVCDQDEDDWSSDAEETDLEEEMKRVLTVGAYQDFNVSPDESERMDYEFGFPNYLSSEDSPVDDDSSPSSALDDNILDSFDDSTLDVVCNYQLDEEEKLAPEQVFLRDTDHIDLDLVNDLQSDNSTLYEEGDDPHIDSSRSCNEGDNVHFIPPPPEAVYDSHEAAEAALHEWTLQHNYNVSRRRVRYLHGTKAIWARNYECDRAGKPKCTQHLLDNERKRTMRGSKRSGCPMRIKICAVSKEDVGGPWKIEHTGSNSSVHNHPPSMDVRVHAAHRRRAANASAVAHTGSLDDFISGQTAAGIPVAKIRAAILHNDPAALVLPKDINNSKLRARKQVIATRTPIEALFRLLEHHKFFLRFEVDPSTNVLRYLMWAHPATTLLYKSHCDVLIMDGTFKTNQYDLPLVNVISMTGMNTVLPVAQCFLSGQKDADFQWFLEKLREMMVVHEVPLASVILSDRELAIVNGLVSVFPTVPTIICRCHLNQNVLARARREFGQIPLENPLPGQDKFQNTWQTEVFMQCFYKTVESTTEVEFESQCVALEKLSPSLASYLEYIGGNSSTK